MNVIRRYIIENPVHWHLDYYNQNAIGRDQFAHHTWHMMRDSMGE